MHNINYIKFCAVTSSRFKQMLSHTNEVTLYKLKLLTNANYET